MVRPWNSIAWWFALVSADSCRDSIWLPLYEDCIAYESHNSCKIEPKEAVQDHSILRIIG